MSKFCKPMRRNWMTTASSNAVVALSMAKELQAKVGYPNGLQSLVKIINIASIELISFCENCAYDANELEDVEAIRMKAILSIKK